MIMKAITMMNVKINMSRLALSAFILSVANIALAKDSYTDYKGKGVWESVASQPVFKVFIDKASVKAILLNQGSESDSKNNQLPAIRLKSVNNVLFNEYAKDYININDFDHDGWLDVGILKSLGYGGGKRCYSVYQYKPELYSFSSRASKTACFN